METTHFKRGFPNRQNRCLYSIHHHPQMGVLLLVLAVMRSQLLSLFKRTKSLMSCAHWTSTTVILRRWQRTKGGGELIVVALWSLFYQVALWTTTKYPQILQDRTPGKKQVKHSGTFRVDKKHILRSPIKVRMGTQEDSDWGLRGSKEMGNWDKAPCLSMLMWGQANTNTSTKCTVSERKRWGRANTNRNTKSCTIIHSVYLCLSTTSNNDHFMSFGIPFVTFNASIVSFLGKTILNFVLSDTQRKMQNASNTSFSVP